ncbi:hypothetical protein QUF80_10825 [Desulfococcaceae bacterium HSG8]|nr:hypothetical protein [Desulfococcaceae bacterium HSG8]
MNDYQKEQSETLAMVHRHFIALSSSEKEMLQGKAEDYLSFRKDTNTFLSCHFSEVCTEKCYQSHVSACCSKDGIITFFADVAINVLMSQDEEAEALMQVLRKPNNGFKCIYLGSDGCILRIKPIVCEMFLCDQAKEKVFGKNSLLREEWKDLEQRKKRYTWPDRPVLFDELEQYFIDAGYSSPLMYMHNSPGLLRVKQLSQSGSAR